MRRIVLGTLAALVLGLGFAWWLAGPQWRALVLNMPTSLDVLFWTQPQREAAFRLIGRLPVIPVHEIPGGTTPRPLPAGPPLTIAVDMDAFAASQHLAGVVVVHRGQVRFERYGLGMSASDQWTSFSVAKSITSTLVGAALLDGHIKSLEDPVSRYLPQLAGSAYQDVSVRQLLTMTSGVAWNEDYDDPNSDVARFASQSMEDGAGSATLAYMARLPRAHPPGEVWNYSTGETTLVGLLVASAVGEPLADYLSRTVWAPYGMEQVATWVVDPAGKEIGGCCIQAPTRDFARFGLFVLDDGVAGGRRVVPEGWFAEAGRTHAPTGTPGEGYGFQWWTSDDGTFQADGIFGQGIFIDPARQLVVAYNANWDDAMGSTGQLDARASFYRAVQQAIDADAATTATQ
jgi:CubicO group peptidase (beta-lactamase class C family)